MGLSSSDCLAGDRSSFVYVLAGWCWLAAARSKDLMQAADSQDASRLGQHRSRVAYLLNRLGDSNGAHSTTVVVGRLSFVVRPKKRCHADPRRVSSLHIPAESASVWSHQPPQATMSADHLSNHPVESSMQPIELGWSSQRLPLRDSREDWTGITNPAERRKLQNRLNQRARSQ